MQIQLKELVDVVFKTSDRIDTYWRFYVMAMTAILAWISMHKSGISPPLAAAITLLAFVICIHSIYALKRHYQMLNVFIDELREMLKPAEFLASSTKPDLLTLIKPFNHRDKVSTALCLALCALVSAEAVLNIS